MKRSWKSTGRVARIALALGVALGVTAWIAPESEPTAPATPSARADNKYIGASKCKACHDSDEKGNQFAVWESGPHAKAFETLASPAAKEAAAAKGIEDPQKADECVRCHTTAFGVDDKLIKRGFKMEMGVQCESCHGPGDAHSKARMKAAMSDDPNAAPEPGEIVASPGQEVCTGCHNEESPTFKPFCFYERVAKIRHLHPDTDESTKLVCGCGECTCTDGCPDDGCGVPPK